MISFAAERLIALLTEALCGAGPGERSVGRVNQRNGYRDRDWQTRAGTVELRIPKSPSRIGWSTCQASQQQGS
jgi:transposase-like protein